MRCPSCRKRVVFGSIPVAAWNRVHAGEWIYGGRPPALGKLGDCSVCGARLEWEPGEALQSHGVAARVHLSALRDSPADWSGRDVWLRALVIEHDGAAFLSDSWRARPTKGEPEDDPSMLERLEREQQPRIGVRFSTAEVRAQFEESSRRLDSGAHAAWIEAEGAFAAEPEGLRILVVSAISSIWPPKD
jgi:hypothetical protein